MILPDSIAQDRRNVKESEEKYEKIAEILLTK